MGCSLPDLYNIQQEELTCQNTKDERLLLSIPKRSECRGDQKTRCLGLWELRRGEPMDCTIPMEVGSTDQISHNRCLDKTCDGIMRELPNISELVDTRYSEE